MVAPAPCIWIPTTQGTIGKIIATTHSCPHSRYLRHIPPIRGLPKKDGPGVPQAATTAIVVKSDPMRGDLVAALQTLGANYLGMVAAPRARAANSRTSEAAPRAQGVNCQALIAAPLARGANSWALIEAPLPQEANSWALIAAPRARAMISRTLTATSWARPRMVFRRVQVIPATQRRCRSVEEDNTYIRKVP